MDNLSLNKFDLRLSYLTQKDIETWNKLNCFARTLWFENYICGPDIEYSRFSVEIFKTYSYYSKWSYVPRQNGGYVLKSPNSTLTINSDFMNGWWNIFKRLANNKLAGPNRKSNTNILFNDFQKISDDDLLDKLSTEFGHNQKVWSAFLDYLNIVYTIGNLTPAGANPGGNGLDLWHNKLSLLKEQWFDQPFDEQKNINNCANRKKTISKWAPFLWHYLYSPNSAKNNWKTYIDDHFFNDYVDEKYCPLPLSLDRNDDNSITLFLTHLSQNITHRGEKIAQNRTISFDSIPYYSIIL